MSSSGETPPVQSPSATRQRRFRRALGLRWWAALVVIPAVLAGVQVAVRGDAIETALRVDVLKALHDEGQDKVKVTFDGRHGVIEVPTGSDEKVVSAIVAEVPGVAGYEMVHVFASTAERRACERLQGKVDKATADQQIPFPGSSSKLGPGGTQMVVKVADLLVRCTPAMVTVGGHTDSHTFDGSALTLARAKAIRRVLVDNGVAELRIQIRGYADTFPVASNDTAAGRAKNNRGSITVSGVG